MIFVCINTFSIGAHRRSSCPCSMSCRGETHFLPLQHCHKFALLHNFETFGFLVTLKFTSIYNHTLFFCRETAMSVYQILGMDSCLGYIYCRVMINTSFWHFCFCVQFSLCISSAGRLTSALLSLFFQTSVEKSLRMSNFLTTLCVVILTTLWCTTRMIVTLLFV